LVEDVKIVIEKYKEKIAELGKYMKSHNLECKPEEVNNLRGDIAKAEFINRFKEIQRLKNDLNQYTDIKEEDQTKIEILLPENDFRAFRGAYLETAQQLRKKQNKNDENIPPEVQQLDFEFVLFASAIIDYDYIMRLVAQNLSRPPSERKITKEQLISLVASSANVMDEREDIVEYINSLDEINGKTEKEILDGFPIFKTEKSEKEMTEIAVKHELETKTLQSFVDDTINRMIFNGEQLSDLFASFDLAWKTRTQKELALMKDLVPLLQKLAEGREISGLKAWES
jgi:type I restriction enzyme R subunit